jgi:hypothetical protein
MNTFRNNLKFLLIYLRKLLYLMLLLVAFSNFIKTSILFIQEKECRTDMYIY